LVKNKDVQRAVLEERTTSVLKFVLKIVGIADFSIALNSWMNE
jgi:hypothetical protein